MRPYKLASFTALCLLPAMGAVADSFYSQTYTGAQLSGLVTSGQASYGGADTHALDGSVLNLSGGSPLSIIYRLALAPSGLLLGATDLVVTVSLDYAQLTADNDLGVALSDGASIVGSMQGDQGTNWSITGLDNNATYTATYSAASLANAPPMTYVFAQSAAGEAANILANNSLAQTAAFPGLPTLSFDGGLDLLLLADGVDELYGIRTLSVVATATLLPANTADPIPTPLPAALPLLLSALGALAPMGRRDARSSDRQRTSGLT